MKTDKLKGQQEAGRGQNQVAVLYKQILPEDTGVHGIQSQAKSRKQYQKHKEDLWEMEERKYGLMKGRGGTQT